MADTISSPNVSDNANDHVFVNSETQSEVPQLVNEGKNDSVASSPTVATTLFDFVGSPDSLDSVAKAKHDAAMEFAGSGSIKSASSEKHGPHERATWKTRAIQHPLVTRVLSSVAGSFLDLPESADGTPRRWIRSWLRFGPLSGVFCMLLAISSTVASLGILAGSNGISTSNWIAPPSTYLAICTAVANLAMRYACIQGVVIAWWYRAARGSTLSSLHNDWRSGTTLRGALTAGRHTGLLSLACIFSTIAVIDGPLLQRASTVKSAPIENQEVALKVSLVPEIPTDFTGAWLRTTPDSGYGRFSQTFNDTFPTSDDSISSNYDQLFVNSTYNSNVAPLWYTDAPLSGFIFGCEGSCKAKIRAPALSVASCTLRSVSTTYLEYIDEREMLSLEHASPLSHWNFVVTSSMILDEREKINLITGHSQPHNCTGIFEYQACTLESAIGLYDVSITKSIATLDDPGRPEILALANNTRVNNDYNEDDLHPSTLSGISYLATTHWESSIVSYAAPAARGGVSSVSLGETFEYFILPDDETDCMSFKDPKERVLASLNQLMVYTAMAATSLYDDSTLIQSIDPGLEIDTQVTGFVEGDQNVFHTNYWYFFSAALVEVICIALVLPTYWGWWTLGRSVSFSPLELAKAFESPMLAECNSNSSGRDIARAVSDVRTQYGATAESLSDGRIKLAFADPSRVQRPVDYTRFDV